MKTKQELIQREIDWVISQIKQNKDELPHWKNRLRELAEERNKYQELSDIGV